MKISTLALATAALRKIDGEYSNNKIISKHIGKEHQYEHKQVGHQRV